MTNGKGPLDLGDETVIVLEPCYACGRPTDQGTICATCLSSILEEPDTEDQATAARSGWKAAASILAVVTLVYFASPSSSADRPAIPLISQSAVDSAMTLFARGKMLQASGSYEQAIDSFRRALALNPTLLEAHYALGDTLTLARRYEEAIAVYQGALQGDVFVLRTIMRIFATMGAWRREQMRMP